MTYITVQILYIVYCLQTLHCFSKLWLWAFTWPFLFTFYKLNFVCCLQLLQTLCINFTLFVYCLDSERLHFTDFTLLTDFTFVRVYNLLTFHCLRFTETEQGPAAHGGGGQYLTTEEGWPGHPQCRLHHRTDRSRPVRVWRGVEGP